MVENVDRYTVENLLVNNKLLFNHIYWVQQSFDVLPANKEHRKTSINFNDIKERREDFLSELLATITDWVYSKNKAQEIIDERLSLIPGNTANAWTFLSDQARSKFRPKAPQGQFGELLLFNFIQYFFKAAPLLRKQSITTSIGHERFGADAIHYKVENEKNILILGESKCYKSNYKFNTAFEESLASIVTTFENLDQELGLYVYEDFIDKELLRIARAYKTGTLPNVHFELVCLIAYNENHRIKGADEQSIKKEILALIEERCSKIEKRVYSQVEANILDKIHYIFFPIFNMDDLLRKFSTKVGSEYD